ncbi:hypothetical protein DIPPA_02324 [Diplonema papillatum]|nr:hypothetical protein DIPPA_05040 [Diplonema papillatum]KAJ9469246.1 hypothetical protein DIPPA_02324 [Diplonema papillatum]
MILPTVLAHRGWTWYQKAITQIVQDITTIFKNAPYPQTPAEVDALGYKALFRLCPVIGACIFAAAAASHFLIPASVAAKGSKDFWHTRVVMLRALGVCYLMVFLTYALEFLPVAGEGGVLGTVGDVTGKYTPVFDALDTVSKRGDWTVEATAWIGVFLAWSLIFAKSTTHLATLACWACMLSLGNTGSNIIAPGKQRVLEQVGLIAVFLCPMNSATMYPRWTPPSMAVIALLRWIAFRFFVAVAIKDLPGELGYVSTLGPVGVLHIMSLYLPFLLLFPFRSSRVLAAIVLIIKAAYTGVLPYTLVPLLACFDDGFFSSWYPKAFPVDWERCSDQELPAVRENHGLLILKSAYQVLRFLGYYFLVLHVATTLPPMSGVPAGPPSVFASNNLVARHVLPALGIPPFSASIRPPTVLVLQYTSPNGGWSPLKFKSIPHDPTELVAGSFAPPLFWGEEMNRFDAEVFNEVAKAVRGRPTPPDGLPVVLEKALGRVIDGLDPEAAALFANPVADLLADLRKVKKPKVRARYHVFSPSAPGSDTWWVSARVPDSPNVTFPPKKYARQPRKSAAAPSRFPLLSTALFGSALSFFIEPADAPIDVGLFWILLFAVTFAARHAALYNPLLKYDSFSAQAGPALQQLGLPAQLAYSPRFCLQAVLIFSIALSSSLHTLLRAKQRAYKLMHIMLAALVVYILYTHDVILS